MEDWVGDTMRLFNVSCWFVGSQSCSFMLLGHIKKKKKLYQALKEQLTILEIRFASRLKMSLVSVFIVISYS